MRSRLLSLIIVFLVFLPLSSTSANSNSVDNILTDAKKSFRAGNLNNTIELLLQAQIITDRSDKIKTNQIILLLAETYRAAGRPIEAINLLSKEVDENKDFAPKLRAQIYISLANSHVDLGDLKGAKQYLTESIKLSKANDLEAIRATAHNSLGNLYALEDNAYSATNEYTESIIISQSKKLDLLQAKALTNRARITITQHKSDPTLLKSARNDLKQANKIAASLADTSSTCKVLISIGSLLQTLAEANSSVTLKDDSTKEVLIKEDLLGAFKAFNTAAEVADRLENQYLSSYALGNLGKLYFDRKRFEEALLFTQDAVLAAQKVKALEILYRWYWQTARILLELNDQTAAINAYKLAIDTLQDDSLRYDLNKSQLSKTYSFQNTIKPLYLEYVELLLAEKKNISNNQHHQNLVAAKSTIEKYRAAELRDYFQDECITELQAKTKKFEHIDHNVAVIYPIILSDKLKVILSIGDYVTDKPDGPNEPIEVTFKKVNRESSRLKNAIKQRKTGDALYDPAENIYSWLVAPFSETLKEKNIKTLVFVPDGPLRSVPMAALYDGQDFLVNNYAVVIEPGLELTDPRPTLEKNIKVLSGGLTESKTNDPPLEHVESELTQIENLYQNDNIRLQGGNFTVSNLKNELNQTPFQIVHIATHGQFAINPNESYLSTYDKRMYMNDLSSYMGISKFRNKPVELLTLSACETAAGNDRAALGLAGVALKSGARSAIASLWKVDDEASSQLMQYFYKNLTGEKGKLTKAQALQEAQKMLIREKKFSDPIFWSPFILIGNWL
ncbi:CHAT domain-containing protein [Kaarinaea lacus]